MTALYDTPDGLMTSRETQRRHIDFGTLLENTRIFGDGDLQKGAEIIAEIADRLKHARGKHPWPRDAKNIPSAAKVVRDEAIELFQAAIYETPDRAHDEAKDVAATSIRFLGKEWVAKS